VIPVTVVMRSYNDGALLPRTLAALAAQTGVRWTLAVFESASRDDSPAQLRAFLDAHGGEAAGHRFTALAPGTYRSSRVLNDGVRGATTALVVFLNSDAVLAAPDTLATLVAPFADDARLAGTFAQQSVRATAAAMTRLDHEIAFRRRARLGAAADWMSLVASAIRRTAWDEVPFDERLTYAEDAVWSVAVAARGWRTRYVAAAVAEHSHDYTPAERRKRAHGDAAALAVLATKPPPAGYAGGVLVPFAKRCLRDAWLVTRLGRPWQAALVPWHRYPQMVGQWQGARAGWQTLHADARAEIPPPEAAP